jgi:hypothetical protein
MKRRFEERSHTLPFAVSALQLFMTHKECFCSEFVSSVVKYHPMLSKDKLVNYL